MNDDQYGIAAISFQDINVLMELKEAAQWNQTMDDWRIILKHCQEGNWAVKYNDKIIGTTVSIPYAEHFNWIGMVLVDPKHRNKGLGTMLVKAAINSTHGHSCHRLDATENGRHLYEKLGFKEETRLSRMYCAKPHFKNRASPYPCRPLTGDDLNHLKELDYHAFGDNRSELLFDLQNLSPQETWVCELDRQVQGYCFTRPGTKAKQIGPLVAANKNIAQTLIQKVTSQYIDQPYLIDTFESQVEWNNYLINSGFEIERHFVRMYLGQPSSFGNINLQYAITGPEWG